MWVILQLSTIHATWQCWSTIFSIVGLNSSQSVSFEAFNLFRKSSILPSMPSGLSRDVWDHFHSHHIGSPHTQPNAPVTHIHYSSPTGAIFRQTCERTWHKHLLGGPGAMTWKTLCCAGCQVLSTWHASNGLTMQEPPQLVSIEFFM